MTTNPQLFTVVNAGGEDLLLDGPLPKDQANAVADEIERDNPGTECSLRQIEGQRKRPNVKRDRPLVRKFAERVRARLKREEMTIHELCKRLGMSKGERLKVYAFLAPDAAPTTFEFGAAIRIAQHLDVSLDNLK